MNERKNPNVIIENPSPQDRIKDLRKTIKEAKKEDQKTRRKGSGNKDHWEG